MPLVGRVYVSWGGYGVTGFLLRGLVASICLLPPTLAMGATLAGRRALGRDDAARGVVARLFLRRQHRGRGFRIAAGGFLSAARLRHDARPPTSPSAINAAVGGLGLLLASRRRRASAATVHAGSGGLPERRSPRPRSETWRLVYVAIALSGFCALAGEVIWTRMLSLLFGARIYTFSHHPRGVPDRSGHRQQPRLAHREEHRAAARRARLVPAARTSARSRGRAHMLLTSLPYWPINAVDLEQHLVQFPARFRARPLGRAARADSVGRELSAGARRRSRGRAGSGPAGRRRVRRQHGRRDRRFAGREPAAGRTGSARSTRSRS